MIHESERIVGGMVYATLTGKKEEVERAVGDYFKRYHPNGYATKVFVEPRLIETGALDVDSTLYDKYEARIERYSSCE